jgi:exopolyphosphatase/guanosine-5'-triphosphate,3'-diphosphate pyrophosphatase
VKKFLYHILFVAFFLSFNGYAKDCLEVRTGFDIGSGSTKMMVAKVDTCKLKIIEVLLTENRAVQYNEDLDKSSDGNLGSTIIEKGSVAFTELIAKANAYKPTTFFGVATSVFRKAKNGAEVIKNYSLKFKIPMSVITQEEEARLGYLSVLALRDDVGPNKRNFVVWDIGGGSMQFFYLRESNIPLIYLGDLASVTFKNMVVEVLESKNYETSPSPNPVGDKREQAIALARSYARIHVPAELKTFLKNNMVIGVGGVHNRALKDQMPLKEMKYTLEDLEAAGKIQSLKKDDELVGEYKTTNVTNLLLVQGFMEGLGIKEVNLVNANLLQGLMIK